MHQRLTDRAGARPMARALICLVGLALVLGLAGCDAAGFSSRKDELARQRGEIGFAILKQGEKRAVFAANGRTIAIEPPEGYCLDEESLSVSQRSAFALIADCMDGDERAPGDSASDADPPWPFPGILTVTVSGEEAFGTEPGAMSAFESLLGTASGGRLLGRGDGSGPGRVVTAQRVDGALYVLVEETAAEGSDSIFAPRFWRSFTEINGRLVLVTVSSFSDRPLGEEKMLSFLAAQMVKLRAANGLPESADEGRIAAKVLTSMHAEKPAEMARAETGGAGLVAPIPPRRPR